MDVIIVTALIGALILLVLAMHASRVSYHTQKSVKASLAELPEFSCDHEVFGVGYYGLVIDERRLKLCLIDKSKKPPFLKVIQAKDVISCEIIEDGNSIVSTNRGSQLGGALVGGLAFGGVGGLAGALSGTKKTIGTATNLALQLTINDTERPVHTIRFIIGEAKKDYLYSGSLHTARRWHSLITVIMRRAAVEINSSTTYMQAPLHSVADELHKLAYAENGDCFSGSSDSLCEFWRLNREAMYSKGFCFLLYFAALTAVMNASLNRRPFQQSILART